MSLDESKLKLQGSERLFEGLSTSGDVLSQLQLYVIPDNLIYNLSKHIYHIVWLNQATNFEEHPLSFKILVAANT